MLYNKKIGFDYDYIGLSYYPFWDGDFENMQSVVKMIRDEFGKLVPKKCAVYGTLITTFGLKENEYNRQFLDLLEKL